MLRRIRIWLAWEEMYETGVWSYQRNEITGERRVVKIGDGYQPVDTWWLETGSWQRFRPRQRT